MKKTLIAPLLFAASVGYAQQVVQDTALVYKKRVLESIEVDFLTSYYTQEGNNAAVSGGIGTEKLTDATPTVVVSIPLNDDDILTIDAGISAYTSASSSNVDPFDGKGDPFQASSGASSSDVWTSVKASYSHSSDDRNNIWSATISTAFEYDYLSIGFGGSYTKLFNEKNTEISVSGNVYLDSWSAIYPSELRPFAKGRDGINHSLFRRNVITGNANYNPTFSTFNNTNRNSYSLGFGFSQILSKRLQGSLALDFVQQQGLLSTPFQRVYFSDIPDSFIRDFQLADDVERLPDTRFKAALGGRLNYYVNEFLVLKSYYRYYLDDWGIASHTASIEFPIKVTDKFTLHPTYRFYNQTAADYFAPYEQHLSINQFYTSDYDLSKFSANQFGFGVSYTDILTKFYISKFGLKSIDLKYNMYERNTGLKANIIAVGFKFVMD